MKKNSTRRMNAPPSSSRGSFSPRRDRDWVLSQSLPLVQRSSSPTEDDEGRELLGQSIESSQDSGAASFRSPTSSSSYLLDPSPSEATQFTTRDRRFKQDHDTRVVSGTKENKKKKKTKRGHGDVLVLECPHCDSVEECHESKYGAFCFEETRRFIMASSSSSVKQGDYFTKYAKVYTLLMNWEQFQRHGPSGLDENLAYVPSCMLVGSYTRVCNLEQAYNA
jgi:hypothetical protein